MPSRRVKLALVVGAVLGASGVASFGPIVRREVARAGERYGAAVTVGEVVPVWNGVRLRGVDVAIAEVPSARVHLDEVDVLDPLRNKRVELRGGAVTLVGPRDEVLREVEAFRDRHLRRGVNGGGAGAGAAVEVEGFSVSWRDRETNPTQSVVASEVRFDRGAPGLHFSAADARLEGERFRVEVRAPDVVLGRRGGRGVVLERFAADALVARLDLSDASRDGGGAQGAFGGKAAEEEQEAGEEVTTRASDAGRGDWVKAAAIRARGALVRLASRLDGALGEAPSIRLSGLRATIRRGADTLNLGPGRLGLERRDGRIFVELSPDETVVSDAKQQALTFRLGLPLPGAPEGPGRDVELDLNGGPIALSTLGIRDGDLGLLNVARTSLVTRSRVVLSGDGQRISLDGDGKITRLSLRNAALSEEPVEDLELAWRAKGDAALSGSHAKVEDAEVDLGSIRLKLRGEYRRSEAGGHQVRLDFDLPLSACQSMLESVPRGLLPVVQGMRMAGSFGVKGGASFDTARIDRDFRLTWDVSNTCRIVEVPQQVAVARFRRPFRRWVYAPDGQKVETESGPETAGWTPFSAISRFMEAAVLTTEDGGFHRHRGFDEEAIKSSIRENLRKGRFVRGASTISMQLAKNLYLDRTKNLARKLQEALLTTYLEQELTKEQILELYLNIVELGPLVYGVGPAARHYFNSSAGELSLSQAFYLSSILPNPKVQKFGAGGAVTNGWVKYLRKLMETAHKRGRITDDDLEEGLRETPVRGAPGPMRTPGDPYESESRPAEAQPGGDAAEEWLGP